MVFEDIMHAKLKASKHYTFQDLSNEIERYAEALTLQQMIRIYDQLTEAHKKLMQNVNPTLVFEQIVIKGVR